MRVPSILRNLGLSAVLMISAAACGGGQSSETSDSPSTRASSDKLQLQDVILGETSAPLTLIEYGSWTCAACLDFHNRILPEVKTNYIDTGKVKVVFREFPTAPLNLSVAGFVLARCAGPEKFYPMIDELFARQSAFLTLARNGDQVTEALKQVGRNHGIADDTAYDACMQSQSSRDAIRASIAAGDAQSVSATPTFLLNGELVPTEARISYERFSAVLDAALAQTTP